MLKRWLDFPAVKNIEKMARFGTISRKKIFETTITFFQIKEH